VDRAKLVFRTPVLSFVAVASKLAPDRAGEDAAPIQIPAAKARAGGEGADVFFGPFDAPVDKDALSIQVEVSFIQCSEVRLVSGKPHPNIAPSPSRGAGPSFEGNRFCVGAHLGWTAKKVD